MVLLQTDTLTPKCNHFFPIYVLQYLSTFSVYDVEEFTEHDAAATVATRCVHVAAQYLVFAKYFGQLDFTRTKKLPPLEIQILLIFFR